jgi:hypothetical protein
MGWYQSQTLIWWLLNRTSRFWHLKNGNWLFHASKRKTSSCNIVSHRKMHMCAQYGHIITNYALILAITLVVWPKCHETSIMIGHFVKDFLWCVKFSKLNIFLATMTHNMTPREDFTLFGSFLNFLCPFQTH